MVKILRHEDRSYMTSEGWAWMEGDTMYASAGVDTIQTRFGRGFICSNLIGGVNTPPQLRRHGSVRKLLDSVFEAAPEHGWAVSLLHPFSFAYYRKFGYEKIADHRILEFPMAKLEYVERYSDLVPLTAETIADAVAIFNEWGKGRNLLFYRDGSLHYPLNGAGDRHIFMYYDGDRPAGYITLHLQQDLIVNHMGNGVLHIHELCYTDVDALYKLLGFVRMFEGNMDMIKIHNCAMMPELDTVLRHYTHTSYQLLPDIMARILDLPAMLKMAEYPKLPGRFTLEVVDHLPNVGGCWQVEYQDGDCEVTRLPEGTVCDLVVTPAALSPILYGYEQYDERMLHFAPGIKVNGEVEDFLRAFPRRPIGLFEHF